MTGYVSNKEDLLKRLRRVEGQIRGLQRMVTAETYCIDVLTQLSAVDSALHKVSLALVNDHISHCMMEAQTLEGQARAAKIAEATTAISRLIK